MMIELTPRLIIEIIAGLGTILGVFQQFKTMKAQQEEMIRQQAIRDERLNERLERLEAKVEEHNGYSEKFAQNSEEMKSMNLILAEMRTDLKWIKERVG